MRWRSNPVRARARDADDGRQHGGLPAPARGLRVDHGPTGFEGYPPETTHFAMTRHMGCWWIHY